jgi:hypothetical protein
MSLPLDIAALQFGSNRVKGESAFVQKRIDRIVEDGAAGILRVGTGRQPYTHLSDIATSADSGCPWLTPATKVATTIASLDTLTCSS